MPGAALALAVVSIAPHAMAQTVVTAIGATEATGEMHHYFAGEKREGIFFFSAGILSAAGGVALLLEGGDRWRAAAGPVLAIGLIQLVAGAIVYTRTDAQVAALDAQLSHDPASFDRLERARMERVNAQFRWLEVIESTLALGGAASAFVGAATHTDLAVGLGAGFAIEGTAMLVLDYLAHQRGRLYQRSLERFAPTIGVSMSDRITVLALTLRY